MSIVLAVMHGRSALVICKSCLLCLADPSSTRSSARVQRHLSPAVTPPLSAGDRSQASSNDGEEAAGRLEQANAKRGEGWPGSWRFSTAGRVGLGFVGIAFLIATIIQLQGA
jgi:hypothetical protein